MIIRTSNSLYINAPKSYLSNPEVAGTNIFRINNTNAFGSSNAIQIGMTGMEQTEVLLLSGNPGAGTLGTTTANSRFAHPADTQIYAIKYDQVVFERSIVGTAGTATPMTDGTVTYQADSDTTRFDDTTGSTSYAYRTYFRNSVLVVNSAESDWITPTGFSFYSLAKIRDRIRGRLYNSDYLQDGDIDNFTNEWLQMMHNAQVDVNESYGIGLGTITYAANVELGTMTATDFRGGFKRVWYKDSTGTTVATKMDSNSFSPSRTFNVPFYYMQGDTVVGRKPIDSAGTFIVEYYKQTPVLANDTDELPIPMQSFTKSFIDYGNAMALHKDNKHQEAQSYETSAVAQLRMFKTQIAPRNVTSNAQIEIVEAIGGDDDGGWV